MSDLDNFLDSALDPPSEVTECWVDNTNTPKQEIYIDIPNGEIDPRLKYLSHSSRLLLHKCPRKYQLYRLNSTAQNSYLNNPLQQLTYDYGTVVGMGVQMSMENKGEDEIILAMFLAWTCDLLIENTKQKKSFWLAVLAVQKFIAIRESGYLDEYELATYNGKPAIELSFKILLPGGYSYRGFVDAVLRHKITGEIVVLECKTSSSYTINPAQFKNSGQAVGYSVVLDKLFPEYSSYSVLYLVYSTKAYEYVELPFDKSLMQRALWLQDLLIDTKHIELYEEYGSYPLHGETCYDFFHECEYLGLCTLSTENLASKLTQGMLDEIDEKEKEYEIVVDFNELVESQLERI